MDVTLELRILTNKPEKIDKEIAGEVELTNCMP